MKILVINCGSSSIKYKLYDTKISSLLAKGLIERIGEKNSKAKNHTEGIKLLISRIIEEGAVDKLEEISAIGHRVVHGGEVFTQPHIIDDAVIGKIKECVPLAPLHNPANLAGILSCAKVLPDTPQVAVFDTAFHQTMPEAAYLYAIPGYFYKKYKIRKYGFHGTSHQFVACQAADILGKPLEKIKLITCHLGNGCSITAIDKGKSIDTSMGFTPLEGLIMGTRSGDIDVAAVFHIMKKEKKHIADMDEILNKKSGLLGISGLSNDFRSIVEAAKRGNRFAKLAYDMFSYRIEKYIGAYYFALGGADAICFTGGIGENSKKFISDIKKKLKRIIDSKTKIMVVPTDEELMIARLTYKMVKGKQKCH
ncbi:MAG: acetate kinase [Candidatus Omnitrophica bacterium]|nr:acetate kinase [Candidatus Omnitrophota bacterium]MDD5430054.1 acetate kinase [Candidatus Omnitrophota bacterium]